MKQRVPHEFLWRGPDMPAGAPLKLNGKIVGRLTDMLERGTAYQPSRGKAEIDAELVDKLGDGSGWGAPKVSFLISRE